MTEHELFDWYGGLMEDENEIVRVGEETELEKFYFPNLSKLWPLRLKKDLEENNDKNRHSSMGMGDTYVLLGEVGNTKHYIVLNSSTGTIVPGMLHLHRFEIIPEDEI